ncbi:MAG: DUF4350 domain-containing protein [Dysgonomonas sp.]
MKDKKTTILIVAIVILVIGLSFAKSKAPKPVDWKPTFINTKTAPYGTYITYQSLGELFDIKNIRSTRVPIYNNLKKSNSKYLYYEDNTENINYEGNQYDYQDSDDYIEDSDSVELVNTDSIDYKEKYNEVDSLCTNYDPSAWFLDLENIADTTSYIFINTRFSLDKLDLEYLLDFAGLGNNVFISTEVFDPKLMDTLKIKSDINYYAKDTIYTLTDYPQREYNIGNLYGLVTLNTDSCLYPVRVLATNNKKDTVFIDVKYGKGHIFLHTIPAAFTNLYMLQTRKYDFGFRSLSYLPKDNKILWDEYQKQGVSENTSEFRVILANPSLRTGLYIILAGLLLFIIFRAKRTQRIIPVIKPPVNSSLEFLGTISNLYYRKKDFTTIAAKRHAYFLDFIRKHYYMTTENIDGEFTSRLSAKSGMDKDKLNELFSLHKDLVILPYVSNEMFLKYNSLLEEFYKNVKNE